MFLNLFTKKKEKEVLMDCPQCCTGMSMSITGKDSTNEYHEIQRKYRCDNCGLEYASLEMIATDGEIGSVLQKVSEFNEVAGDLDTYLKILNNAVVKLNSIVVRKRTGEQGMN